MGDLGQLDLAGADPVVFVEAVLELRDLGQEGVESDLRGQQPGFELVTGHGKSPQRSVHPANAGASGR